MVGLTFCSPMTPSRTKLYLNKQKGTFERESKFLGHCISEDGVARAAWAVDVGDYDRSGGRSLMITNLCESDAFADHTRERFVRG